MVFNEEMPLSPPSSLPKTNAVDEWLHHKYQEALHSHQPQINLTFEDIKQLRQDLPESDEQTPPAMLAMGKLLFNQQADLIHDPKNGSPRNFYFYLYHANGPGVGTLLGRFCHGDASLRKKLQDTITTLEPDSEDVVYAEIDHLPGQRVGNVILRPKLRDYTIHLGGAQTNDPYQIPVADLWLQMTKDNQFVLFSPKLGKTVIPRMSSAHNFSHNAHPLYKFLCDLQYQQTYQHIPPFFKSSHWQTAPYFPRLVYDNLILSPQTWVLNKDELETLGFKKNQDELQTHWEAKLQALQTKRRLPDEVLLVEGDNKLYLNLKNPLCLDVFLRKIFKNIKVTLEEVIEHPFPSQDYNNEMIFPIINTQANAHNEPAANAIKLPAMNLNVPKNFAFGSEWIYYKIYLGNLGADRLIVQHLYPLSQELKSQGLVQDWFFIRYTDSEFGAHLRWRFKLTELRHFGQVVQRFSQTLLHLQSQQLIIHAQPDTYQREINRYLPYNMATSEALFGLDSWWVCHALYLLAIDTTSTLPLGDLQLRLALQRIQALFQGFELAPETIQKIVQNGSTNFSKEFGFDKHSKSKLLKKSLQNDYLKQLIKPALHQEVIPGIHPEFQELMHQFTQAQQPILTQVKENLLQNGGGEPQVISLVSSYIHMFVNRFFSTTQRFQEMWLYRALEMALENPK